MEPEVYEGKAWQVESTHGTQYIPREVCGRDTVLDYIEGSVSNPDEDIQLVKGWLGRMQAPGYLDATDWCFGATEEEVLQQLRDYYGLDEDEDESEVE